MSEATRRRPWNPCRYIDAPPAVLNSAVGLRKRFWLQTKRTFFKTFA
jgi:hypothetical protein